MEKDFKQFFSCDYELLKASEKYAIYTQIVTNAIQKNTPKKKIVNSKIHRNPVPWWDEEYDKAKRLRKASFLKWKFSKKLQDYTDYKKQCAIANKLFKSKRRINYKKFVESIDVKSDQTHVWNTCKILKNKWVKIKPRHTTENHQPTNKIQIVLDKISPAWCATNPDWLPKCKENKFLSSPFSFKEFNIALDSKRIHSSPGLDGLDYESLQKLPTKYKLILLDIYNEMFKTTDYPQEWKNSFVHFIEKGNGLSVRPITLTSCLNKLFETLIKNKLQWWVENKNFIPKSQSGFRKGRSTVDNLTNLVLDIEDSFNKKKDVLAAFLDISAAFDNVNVELLLTRLASIDCPLNLIQFIKFEMKERVITTESTGDSIRLVHKGVPQGGVLSPLLYCIYVAKITEDLPKSVKISQFADDIGIWCNRGTALSSKKILQKSITLIYENLYSLGLELNPRKTILNHFSKRNAESRETEITIKGVKIKSSKTVKFLGVIFVFLLYCSTILKIVVTIKK